MLSNGSGVSMPASPINTIILLIFISYIFILHFFWKSDLKKWLSSIPATVTAIAAYSILVVLMGFIPQIDASAPTWIRVSGLSHINRSWEFLFISIYMLTILGLVILRRFKKFNFRNIAFFLNHAGIFLIISAASIASGDLERLTLPLYINQQSEYAYKDGKYLEKLPFSIKLDSFRIDYFTPQLLIYNPHTKQIYNEGGVDYTVEAGKKITYQNYTFTIEETLSNAYQEGNKFIPKDTSNTEFAALVNINNDASVWVSSGNYLKPSTSVMINDEIAISLSLPEDKKYISYIDLSSKKCGNLKNVKLLVNKPIKYCGYDIYQQSYQKNPDSNFDISILELVHDPWLPVIYFGLIMLFVGAVLMFWLGKKID